MSSREQSIEAGAGGPETRVAEAGRMRVLCAIPSTNQMYSGVGRAIRELAIRLKGAVAYQFAIDDMNTRNLELLRGFAAEHGMPLHVGRHRVEPDCVDPGNTGLEPLLRRQSWDAVELVGFANAAVGRAVLEHLGSTPLIYTPHDQPLWTVPMDSTQASTVDAVHQRVLERADLVLADPPGERDGLQGRVPWRSNVATLPLGCDFTSFVPGSLDRQPFLLFVGDLNEARKRFDRVAALMSSVIQRWPQFRLVVAGNRSDELGGRIPTELAGAVELRGYVSESELRQFYARSRGLVLLSDVEAFGLPILEALACGTPVFLGDLATTRGLFGEFRSAHFCPLDDPRATWRVVETALASGPEAITVALAERPRLRARFDWDQLAERKLAAMRAAWFQRRAWTWMAA